MYMYMYVYEYVYVCTYIFFNSLDIHLSQIDG